MHIALLAPLAPEQNGIADYAGHLKAALLSQGVEVSTPLAGIGNDPERALQRVASTDWRGIDLVHAELGGGRLAEFHALRALRERFPTLPLTATVHDPERLVWRRARLPWPLSLASRLPSPLPQMATVLADPLCLYEERQLARSLTRLVTLTQSGNDCLKQRMGLRNEQMVVIAHGNLLIPPAPLPDLNPLKLLYFGFIYRGKGIEDLLEALAMTFMHKPELKQQLTLTREGEHYLVNNPTPYYVTLIDARRTKADQTAADFEPLMVAPNTSSTLGPTVAALGTTPVLTYVNDYGGRPALLFKCSGNTCQVDVKASQANE